MRCGAHTLQLAVCDGLQKSKAGGAIGRIRNVAIEARTPKISEIIRKHTKKVVLLDMETRWGSIFTMVERVIELRPTIEEIADCGNQKLSLTAHQWEQAVELRDLLQKAFEVTKKVQYADCSPGYFYRKWSGLRLYYENNGSILATEIAKSMEKRESDLCSNNLLFAAVLLDVNNMDLLPESSAERARETVINLALRIQGLKEDTEVSDDEKVSVGMSEQDTTDSDEDMRTLRKKQRTSVSSSSESDEELPNVDKDMELELSTATGLSRTPSQKKKAKDSTTTDPRTQLITAVSSGLDKLAERKSALRKKKKPLLTLIEEEYPAELQDVARLLYTMPVTQVSVERLFSALKIFKRDHRSRLKEDILSSLLLLKANK